MYFPWVGLLEQIRLAEVFVHYDDVQLTRGFYNRIQVKTQYGVKWLTVPLRDHHQGQSIDETMVDERTDWRSQHRAILRQAYFNSPFRDDMLALVDRVFNQKIVTLVDVSRSSMLALADYFNIREHCRFVDSKVLAISGKSSQRLHDMVKALGGDIYITGHGARNYLDHELLEISGITVQYMEYQCTEYQQQNGVFTPYVTGLDLVANCGRDGARVIKSKAIDWRQFINESN
jgi:hypothetical protein